MGKVIEQLKSLDAQRDTSVKNDTSHDSCVPTVLDLSSSALTPHTEVARLLPRYVDGLLGFPVMMHESPLANQMVKLAENYMLSLS